MTLDTYDMEDYLSMMADAVNEDPKDRAALEKENGQVWDSTEFTRDFDVRGYMNPLVSVTRKSDKVQGTMVFQNKPRFYWGFTPTVKA